MIIKKIIKRAGQTLLLICTLISMFVYAIFLAFELLGNNGRLETSPNTFFMSIDDVDSFWSEKLIVYFLISIIIILQGFLIKKHVYNINKIISYLIIGVMLFLNIYASLPNIHLKGINYDSKKLIDLADNKFPDYLDNWNFTKAAAVYFVHKDELENPHHNTRLMQMLLNEVGYWDQEIDGDPKKDITTQFLRFQKENNLIVDGVIGNETMKVLFRKVYVSELKKLKNSENLRSDIFKLNMSDSAWGLGIISNPLITNMPIYAYGLYFSKDPYNTPWIEIDSMFYELVLKNHNIDIPKREWISLWRGCKVKDLPYWQGLHNELIHSNSSLRRLCDEFLDTLTVLSIRNDGVELKKE